MKIQRTVFLCDSVTTSMFSSSKAMNTAGPGKIFLCQSAIRVMPNRSGVSSAVHVWFESTT